MIMSLKNNIDIVCIEYRSKLSTENHTICVGMIKPGTVNILMDCHDTPFCIRVSFYCFFNGVLMFCNIVVVGVQNNEKSFAIAVVVVAAGCCFSVFSIIWVIEMIGIVRIQGIMITDCCCDRKRFQSICTQIGSVLFFFCFTCFVYLVTCGDNEVHIRIFGKGSVECTIPGKTIVFSSGVGSTGFVCQFCTVLSLTFGSTNLWIADIEHFYGICFLSFIFAYICLLAIFFYCIIVGCFWFKASYRYVVIFIGFVTGKILIYITGSTFKCLKIIFISSKMYNRSGIAVTFFTVPCEVELCIISTRGKGYFCKISGCICPVCIPVRPSGVSTGNAAVCVMFSGSVNGRTYSCNRAES